MSRTIKDTKQKTTVRKRKTKPYVTDKEIGSGKFKATKTDLVPGTSKGVSKYDKLITRNANRSKKKALRQSVKLLIKKELL